MTTIMRSMAVSPRWADVMARHQREMTRIDRQGAIDVSRIWAETSAAISDMQKFGWQERRASADRMMAITSDQIREVRPLREPATGQALMPAAALAQESFSVPLLVDFEDSACQRCYDHVAAELDAVLQDGKLVAESAADAGSCRISKLRLADHGIRATCAAHLATLTPSAADRESMHAAGLMIRYAEDTGTSFLAFLARGRQYDLLTFVDGAIGQRIRGSIDDGVGPLRLAAREAGSGAEIFSNEVPIGSFSDSRVQGSRVGLIHCGPGRYVFDDCGINTRGDLGFAATALDTDRDAADQSSSAPAVASATGAGGPPPVPDAVWWVDDDGTPLGPLTLPQRRARLADGRSDHATLVWRDGMDNWLPAAPALP